MSIATYCMHAHISRVNVMTKILLISKKMVKILAAYSHHAGYQMQIFIIKKSPRWKKKITNKSPPMKRKY